MNGQFLSRFFLYKKKMDTLPLLPHILISYFVVMLYGLKYKYLFSRNINICVCKKKLLPGVFISFELCDFYPFTYHLLILSSRML